MNEGNIYSSHLLSMLHTFFFFAKVISPASGGRCDYFSPYSADSSFIVVASDGKQGGVVADAE